MFALPRITQRGADPSVPGFRWKPCVHWLRKAQQDHLERAGCGNLSAILCRKFPDASIRLVDFSGRLLEPCRDRLSEFGNIQYQEKDFRSLDFAPGSLDLIVSSISLHHLAHEEKTDLLVESFGWLENEGVFSYSDQFAGVTDDLYARQTADWKERSKQRGACIEEWDAGMEHQDTHDHHATLVDQIEWLRKAGSKSIDCTWRYILRTVLQARKQST